MIELRSGGTLTVVNIHGTSGFTRSDNIDHIVSDTLTGTCWAAGVTSGHPAVSETVYFDHNPIVCDVGLPPPVR